MPKIEVLVGMVASGKSTYAKKRAKEGAIIVNDDAIVLAVHGGEYILYNENLKALYKGIETSIVHQAILAGRDVVIDSAHNLKYLTRRRWLEIANSLDCTSTAVVFFHHDYPEHAKRRYYTDTRDKTLLEWERITWSHWLNYSFVEESEGFTNIVRLDKNGHPIS